MSEQVMQTAVGEVAVRFDGSADAPVLLLCQRFRGSMKDWDPRFLTRLSRGRRIIRFDMPGIGSSPGQTPDTVHGMAAVVHALLDALAFDRIDVLGWSLGGYVAQAFALTHPERVRRLVIAGSGPGGPNAPAADPRVAPIARKEAATRDDLAFLFFDDSDGGRKAAHAHLNAIAYDEGSLPRQESGLRQLNAIVEWTKGNDAAKQHLDLLTMPILVANGINDVMVPADNSIIIAKTAPDAKLILYPNAGHAFLFQYAEDFADEVERFLTR